MLCAILFSNGEREVLCFCEIKVFLTLTLTLELNIPEKSPGSA